MTKLNTKELRVSDPSGSLESENNSNNSNKSDSPQFEDELEATNITAKSIKAINKTTVHRICSGQVVLTLATAVKELVENSVDAGATTVEVRLNDYGSTTIEVTDNGKGVEPCDFEGLTLKHHTSKLQDFGDLIGVKTFGFRGEALSSLCALSNLAIISRHTSQAVGTKLIYNTNGNLLEKIPVSRQIGTTVSLQNLFYTLPVRHKEFIRNLKKEFNKMVQVLYSYCLITTEVRIVCTNQVGKNIKTTIVSTESQSSLKNNISSIFGPKQVSNLLEIEQMDPIEEILNEYKVNEKSNEKLFRLEGFISSCAHGKGRSSSDRQFYFINKRPCDPSKVMRVVNDVYHHYNKHQFPMVVLNIEMEEGDVDVNVTPDKRQILVSRERLLLATIKTTLVSLYEDIPSTFNIKSYSLSTFSSPKMASSPSTPNTKLSSLSQRFSRTPSGSPIIETSPCSSKTISSSYGGIKRSLSSNSEFFQGISKQPKLQDYSFKLSKSTSFPEKQIENTDEIHYNNSCIDINEDCHVNFESIINQHFSDTEICSSQSSTDRGNNYDQFASDKEFIDRAISSDNTTFKSEKINSIETESYCKGKSFGAFGGCTTKSTSKEIHLKTDAFLSSLKSKKNNSFSIGTKTYNSGKLNPEQDLMLIGNMNENESKEEDISAYYNNISAEFDNPKIIYEDRKLSEAPQKTKSRTVSFSFESLKAKMEKIKSEKLSNASQEVYRKFRAQISPTENQTAEEELKKEIAKDSFKEMEILGQFNLGFIIARLKSDLFIVDQHATDEKYNFETLQKSCILQNQKLIIPQTMELTAANEGILIDNMDIFIKNGFEFKVDDTKEVGRRVKLISMPHSRGWEFNKEDVEEMIFMLSDSPGVMCRPSRINAMFASRACRKSVMIGTHLSLFNMRKLVDHMSEIEQPWNCPHGRPTIRHLINLDVLKLN